MHIFFINYVQTIMRINEHKVLNAHSTIIEKNETNSNTTYQLSASREFDTLA